MKTTFKLITLSLLTSTLLFNCSKDDEGTSCGDITYLGADNQCPDGYIITVDDGTTIMSRCVKQSDLNGLSLGEYYCLFE
jgi:hypothetical protein